MTRRGLKFIGMVMILGAASAASAREWHDSSGEFSLDADFVAQHDGKVVLKKRDGRETSLSLDSLSVEDRQFVQILEKQKTETRAARDESRKDRTDSEFKWISLKLDTDEPEAISPPAPARVQQSAYSQLAPPSVSPDGVPVPGSPACGKPPCEYIYEACCGKFWLDGCRGIAHYCIRECECGCLVKRLCCAKLEWEYTGRYFYHYKVVSSNCPCIKHWCFAKCPDCFCDCCDCCCCDCCCCPCCCCECGYSIWYSTKEFPRPCDWCYYGCASRCHPCCDDLH